MSKLTELEQIRISKEQKDTLKKLKEYNIKVPQFIRDAIREKIKRDWPKIKEYKYIQKEPECPF